MKYIKGKNASKWFDIGYDAGENGKYDDAIDAYSKAIELDPDDATAYNNRGLAYYNKGEYDTAIKDYSKAIELKPDYAAAYNNRGLAYYNKREYDTAIKDLTKAIELDPDYAVAYNNRGNAYRNNGQYDTAIKDYSKAIELDPNDAAAYNNRGNAYKSKGQYDNAIKDYSKAIELAPDCADAYHNRGLVYERLNKWCEKIADYKKVLSFGVDENGKTKNGRLKSSYERWIKEAEPKAEAQERAEAEARARAEAEARAKAEIEAKLKAEARAKAKEEEQRRLISSYNAAKLVRTFDSSVLKYLHSFDESSMCCQIPEWAERIVSYTADANNRWIKTIKISKNVTVIENDALRGCPNLERVDFSEATSLRTIEKNAFAGCNKLMRVGVPKNCEAAKGAFPKKCKIERIDVRLSAQPTYVNMPNAPAMPVVTNSMREKIGFNSLNESIAFGGDILRQELSAIGGAPGYSQPSVVTAPLNDTTMRGGFGDSVL